MTFHTIHDPKINTVSLHFFSFVKHVRGGASESPKSGNEATHQVSFGGYRYEDEVVAYSHLLTLGSLLAGRVNGPPTRLP